MLRCVPLGGPWGVRLHLPGEPELPELSGGLGAVVLPYYAVRVVICAAFIAPGCVMPRALAMVGQEWPALRASSISSARRAGIAFMRLWNAVSVSSVSSAIV